MRGDTQDPDGPSDGGARGVKTGEWFSGSRWRWRDLHPVTREEYLVDPSVQDFVDWLRPVVGGDVGFAHRYRALHSRCDWRCESLWNACGADGPPRPDRGYWWNRKGFGDNQRDLDGLSTAVRQASETGDGQLFLRAARGVLEWGGVRRNLVRLDNLGMGALPTFVEAARLLDPSRADTGLLDGIGDLMNSGWTKVYALISPWKKAVR